jgi:DNA-binding NarL/FixJ family response regulator
MPPQINVLLTEDDDDFAFLIGKLIEDDAALRLLGRARGREESLAMARELRPDVAVVDLNLSGSELDGIDAARDIVLSIHAKVLLLTSYEQPEIVINAAKRAFASGYVYKSQCKTLADTIRRTALSRTPQELFIRELLLSELTAAERAVVQALLGGNIDSVSLSSPKTITNQKTSIFKKLGLKSTDELLAVFGEGRCCL